jgi:histidinol phosphatase-like PHP family hydrolase
VSSPLDNAAIAELLALEAARARPPLSRALRRASRQAFLWPEEVGQLVANGRSLTELRAIGPHIERIITGWLENDIAVPEPAEVRLGFLTLTAARAALARHPGWSTMLKGDLQMHTVWSDGAGSIQDMVDAATPLGYEYIAITDHSKGLKIAGGISEAELSRQAREILRVNKDAERQGRTVRALRSLELNLNPRGEGDMTTRSLARLDIVLGCFHSSLRTKDDQTERYIRALRNPTIQILGHPRGRVYNFRLGLTADWPRVFGVAAELDKAVEIDAYPDRQDLSVPVAREAQRAGCRISLGTDAHDPSQLRFIEFGLAAALLAGVAPERILNFMTRSALLDWVANVRAGNAA